MPSNILAALAGLLQGTSSGIGTLQQDEQKRKQIAIDNALKQSAESRLQRTEDASIENMHALRALGEKQYASQQEQQGRVNTHQDLMDVDPFSKVPDISPALIERAKAHGLEGLMRTSTLDPGSRPGQVNTGGAFSPQIPDLSTLQSLQQTVRTPTGAESEAHTLHQSQEATAATQRATAEHGLLKAQTQEAEQEAAKQRIVLATKKDPTGRTVDPMDVFLASGHSKTDVFPQAEIDVKNATYKPPTIADFTGMDANGNATSVLRPRVVGQEVTAPPKTKSAAEKAQDTLSKGVGAGLDRLEEVSHEIITNRGLAQMAKGTIGEAQAAMGLNDSFREFGTLRELLAPAIAKQLAGRVNAIDMKAALDALSKPTIDTPDSSKKLFANIRRLLQLQQGGGTQSPETPPAHALDYINKMIQGNQLNVSQPQTFNPRGGGI